ncbi:dCTP deaminase [Streptomyces sp. NPDC008079]|uniref:dCTP deaminase n=1 Tax=Streptomyces sp. NPDC008079 TaxID=3364806 RepID=UPI0036E5F798
MLNDRQIADRLADGSLIIKPFHPDRIQPASVDLTLHHLVRVPRSDIEWIDVAAVPPNHTDVEIIEGMGWEMEPFTFILASTRERIALPADLVGRVEGKSSLGRLGLAVHITAGFIDPGFHGQITLEIANLSPWTLVLHREMPVAQLALIPMSEPSVKPYGEAGNHYQGQGGGPVESRYRL